MNVNDITHPFVDGNLPGFPDELANGDNARHPHPPH